jgi:iron(III) transport system permease protein
MAFYPYVFVLAKAAFQEQSPAFLNVGRALGCTPWALFWRVALPLARPAIWAGAAIVMMEVLGDFGAVDYFAVPTLTTGVFSVWTQGNNPAGAAQLACVALGVILALVWVERTSRGRQRFHALGRSRLAGRIALSSMQSAAAFVVCCLPVLLGFGLPVGILLHHAANEVWDMGALTGAVLNSAILAVLTAALIVAGALLFVFAARQSRRAQVLLPFTSLGYAAPGAVLALGVLVPFAAFDNFVADTVETATGTDIGLLLTGSVAALVFALFVRFFAIGQSAFDTGLGRVSPSMDMAARTLGQGPGGTLLHVHLPMIRGSLLAACLLVLVDTVKELPATLMLRPFNFETLSTLTFAHASVEDIGGAAPPALVITGMGLIPVLLLALLSRQNGNGRVGAMMHG